MKECTTIGLICLKDDLDIEYKIAKLTYTEREDESFTYIFTPCYNVIELLSPPVFQGIQGLDLELHKEEYIRENRIPVFISERTPGKNREDLGELLEQVGMQYLNQLEWLIRTETRYPGDRFYVKRYTPGDEKKRVMLTEPLPAERAGTSCRKFLDIICRGDDIEAQNYVIDDTNRRSFYSLLISLYRGKKEYSKARRAEGIGKSAAQGKYRGRQRIQIDDRKAAEIFDASHLKQLTEAEALDRLGISRSTFYRRLKEYEK